MTTLYAQSTGNWDAINWNTAANGSGSNQTPGASDTLVSNSYTVTVNGNYTVTQVTNTSGGTFSLANGVTLTCTDATAGVLGGYAAGYAVTFSLAFPNSATLVANCKGGTSNTFYAVGLTGTGTINITGNLTGGVSGTSTTQWALRVTAAGTANVTGNVISDTQGSTIDMELAGSVLNVVGNVVANNRTCIYTALSTSITITGNVSSAVYSAIVVDNNSQCTLTITGSVTCNSTYETSIKVGAHASSVTSITGTLTPSSLQPAILGTGGQLKVSGPMLCNSSGQHAISFPNWRWTSSLTPTYFQIPTHNLGSIRSLYTADSVGGNPSASDVRSGTTFGPSSELTGTLAVPPAGSVTLGVPVDNTTGTAAITAADISAAVWDTLVADLDTANSIGARLAQAATVPSTGAQIAALGV